MPSQPSWARPRQVALLIVGYLLVHLAVRLWMGLMLGVDDAEQMLFAQHWLWNYRFRAPPLFTWMLVAASSVTDIGMVAISLIRYALLAMIFGLTYLTARRLISDARLAALATFSFAAMLRRTTATMISRTPPCFPRSLRRAGTSSCGCARRR